MLRRLLCLVCAVLLIAGTVPALSEDSSPDHSYDFDLTFSLNTDAFPGLLRARVSGYASLINRLGLRGNLSWSTETQSVDLDAVLYLTDNPSATFPFRLYGAKKRMFFTSPMIDDATIMLNMEALMEFAIKVNNNLGFPMPHLALLDPYTTEFAVAGLIQSWQEAIGTFTESGKVLPAQFRRLSKLWENEFQNSDCLCLWTMGVSSVSEAPSVVESELNSIPDYLLTATGTRPVQVTVSPGSQVWQAASGDVLFARQESEGALSLVLSLPASDTGYVPFFSCSGRDDGRSFTFDLAASVTLDPSASAGTDSGEDYGFSDDDGGYGDDEDESGQYDGYDGDLEDYSSDPEWDSSSEDLPAVLLDLRAKGSGFPCALPADSGFSLSASVLGVVFPNYSFCMAGETKKDGSLTLSLTKPYSGDSDPVEILRCTGTVLPAAEPKKVPDYMLKDWLSCYNIFSFNEQSLADFTGKVIPAAVRNVISFVAAVPTAACQSLLDDLTDIGLLDMLLDR